MRANFVNKMKGRNAIVTPTLYMDFVYVVGRPEGREVIKNMQSISYIKMEISDGTGSGNKDGL